MSTLQTLGYLGRRPADIPALLRPGTIVLDIRLNAWSANPSYSKAGLREAIEAAGHRYRHEPRLGNRAYRSGGMEIADPSRIALIVTLLDQGHVALLCACAEIATCHRLVVTEMVLDARPETEVHHL